jgi:hypothetical protein
MYSPMDMPTTHHFPQSGHCQFLSVQAADLNTLGLHTRVVQSPTRERLLSNGPSWGSPVLDSNLATNSLLDALSRLAPSVAKDLIPKCHVDASLVFRLINDINFCGQESGYIALSYCRQRTNPQTPRRVVTPVGDLPFGWTKEIEHFPLPTSNALFQAVLQEKRIGEGLWFDQVCINEADELERATAIGAIDTVYKNARAVVVALDDVLATPEEEHFLRVYVEHCLSAGLEQQPNLGQTPPFMSQYDAFKTFFERIIFSEWSERAWCAHEMKMGRDHVFLVPCYRHHPYETQTVVRFTGAFFLHMLELASELPDFTPVQHARIRSLSDFFGKLDMEKSLGKQRPDTPQLPLPEPTLVVPKFGEMFQMKTSGNPLLPEYLRRLNANRDKMCIALNASGLPLALAPPTPFQRPNIEDECLRTLLLIGLAARDPVSLCTTGTPLTLHDGSISWLSRPTPLDVNVHRLPPARFSNTGNQITQGTDGQAEYVQLDLVFLDLPHRLQPSPLFPNHIARARAYIQLCIQCQLQGPPTWDFWQMPNHPRAAAMQNVFVQTLACVFECGPQWLLEVSAAIQHPNALKMDPQAVEMLLNPNLIVQNYIRLPEGQTALCLLLNVVSSLILFGVPWASGANERTHGPLIVAAPSPSETGLMSPRPNTGKAIVFAPFEYSKTFSIAVPNPVKGAEYDALARGWILTSTSPFTGSAKPTVSWKLQSKGVVFGDGNFNAALARCGGGDVRNHRVYGPSQQQAV